MNQQFFEMVLRKVSSLREPMVRLSSVRTLILALFMVLGVSNALADDVAMVMFDTQVNIYDNFDDAIAAANNASTDGGIYISLLKDCSAKSAVTINEDKRITISCISYTLTAPSFIVNGNLTIADGTYKASSTSNNYFFKTTGENSSLTVKGATIDATAISGGRAIWADEGSCVIDDGTIKGSKYGLYVFNASVTLNGGTFYGADGGIFSYTTSKDVSTFLGDDKKYFILDDDNDWTMYEASGSSIDYTAVKVATFHTVAAVTFDGTTTHYDTFSDALTYANNLESTADNQVQIKLMSDCSTERATIQSGKYITLSGGSYTLTTSDCIYIDGNLTINDGTYVSTSTTVKCINVQGGSVILNGGTFSGDYSNNYAGGSIHMSDKNLMHALGKGKIYYDDDNKLWGGPLFSTDATTKVTVKDAGSLAALVHTGRSNVGFETFENALHEVQELSLAENSYKIILLKDCSIAGFEAPTERVFSIYANKYTLTLTDKVQVRGDLIIGDGTIKADDWEPNDADNTDELFYVTGTLTVSGGVIDANYILRNAIETGTSGDVKISGGTIQGATQYALYIYNAETGSVLSGGSLSANNAAIHVPSSMPVCYLLKAGTTFKDYQDDFFASETSNSVNIVKGFPIYKRNVTSGNYGSLCLPFYSLTQSGLEAVYEVSSVSADKVELKDVERFSANRYIMMGGTPYIFKSNESTICINIDVDGRENQPSTNEYLVGNYAATYVPAGNYVLQDNQFCKVEADNTIKSGSYRCYLNGNKVPSEAKANILNIGGETETTAIDALNTLMNNDAAIYDVNGRRLQSLQKGINIVNGKKIIVK